MRRKGEKPHRPQCRGTKPHRWEEIDSGPWSAAGIRVSAGVLVQSAQVDFAAGLLAALLALVSVPARSGLLAQAAHPSPTDQASRGDSFTVALDAGHGGSNLGAEGAQGVLEKQLTLDLARRIEWRLRERGQIKVVMCRSEDEMVPVRARVRCANQAGARLFLSLHANSSPMGPKRGTQRGFELYVLPPKAVAADARAAAATATDPALAAFSAHRIRASAREAVAAASRIAWRLGDALGVDRDRGIKQGGASTDVLEGLQMPGVLIEVGFLDHPVEGPYIVSEEGRAAVADALVRAIEDQRARERRGRTDPSITGKRSPAR
jgi:N-acetylmuramoyl-L-alanine amidase